MKILGISAYYHDAAACLVDAGAIVAAAQQERFSRIKNDAAFPAQAIRCCLAQAGLAPRDLDAVVFYEKPITKFDRILETYLAIAPGGFRSFRHSFPVWMKEKFNLKGQLLEQLALLGEDRDFWRARLRFSEHHLSHAAAAFYPSPFAEAAVITLDGTGEWSTGSVWHGTPAGLKPLAELHFPHSLGLLYSAFTQYLGFKVNEGEYKVMGLAAFGTPRLAETIRSTLLDLRDDGSFRLHMDYFDFTRGLTMTSPRFHALFGGPPRAPDAPLTQQHKDLACSLQQVTEELLLRIARHAHALTGARALCMAGGVALNCSANGVLKRQGPFRDIWVQPAAGDAGSAIGAALAYWHAVARTSPEKDDARDEGGRNGVRTEPTDGAPGRPGREGAPLPGEAGLGAGSGRDAQVRPAGAGRDGMRAALLGPAYGEAEIIATLQRLGLPYRQPGAEAMLRETAQALAAGKVVGWFQGRAEFGPRALGARSILANAAHPDMKDIVNRKIKKRESFRPFAPAVRAEKAAEWFEMDDSPYMLFTCRPVSEAQRQRIPAAVHVDGTARLQTVRADEHPRFHRLLCEVEALTGVPVLLNTSFNVKDEPIVNTPEDAVRCMLNAGLDLLVMETIVVEPPPPGTALRA